MLQLRVCMLQLKTSLAVTERFHRLQLKILCAAMKTEDPMCHN